MIDHNAFLGQWPFRNLGDGGSVSHLGREIARHGISEAWVSGIETLFRQETRSSNLQTLSAATSDSRLRFVPVIRPGAPDAEGEIRDMLNAGWEKISGIRIVPGYTGVAANCDWGSFLSLVESRNVPLLITLRMLDERNLHPLFPVRSFGLAEALVITARRPMLRTIICGARLAEIQRNLDALAGQPLIQFDTSALDGADALRWNAGRLSADRFVPGSNYPIFSVAASALKITLSRRATS